MSQEYSKKEPSRFQPELDACKLCAYTTHILVNRKYFPEDLQETIVPKIVDAVFKVAFYVNQANKVEVKPSLDIDTLRKNYSCRLELQSRALNELEWIKTHVRILKLGYHLASHKANAWTREINKTIGSIKNWHLSENKKRNSL